MAIAQTAPGSAAEANGGVKETLGAGVVAGIIGGMLMAMIMMIVTAVKGTGFFAPLRLIAATVYGKDAMSGGGPLLLGLMMHMMNSMVFGVIFARIAGRRLTEPKALMAGVAFGIAIWVVMTFGGLPLVNAMMREQMETMPTAWFIAHGAFGMGVGLAPALRRRFA